MDDSGHMKQIGEVAEEIGLSLRTIRYYDEVGLAPPSGRSPGGFRLYTDLDVERLRLIKNMKPLDFTLEEMRDLLDTRDRLRDPGSNEKHRNAAHERLQMYATAADERCERLREQLEWAESLARSLRSVAPPTRRRAGRTTRVGW